MRVLAIALCALQAVSSERDEHGMRQALRLARMRAPRERRGPGAGRAQGRTGGMRDFYGGANRTRLWPRTKHLQPLLPATPNGAFVGRRLLRFGPPHVAIDALVCVRRVARAPRRRRLGCLCGYARREPLLSFIRRLERAKSCQTAREPTPDPGLPLRCLSHGKQVQGGRQSHVDRSSRTSRPTTGSRPARASRASTPPRRSGRASGASSTSILIYLSTRSILLHLW